MLLKYGDVFNQKHFQIRYISHATLNEWKNVMKVQIKSVNIQ